MDTLDLTPTERTALWSTLATFVENYSRQLPDLRVSPTADPKALRAQLSKFRFETPEPIDSLLKFVVEGLTEHQLHTSHPSYFGVFNPAPTAMGIAGEWLAAAFNPQLASWVSSPFAIEVEQHVVRRVAELFGYTPKQTQGSFTSGGTEANHTALLLALTKHFPKYLTTGLTSLNARPILYVSSESHHSFLKAARLCGLGSESVQEITADRLLRMDVSALRSHIERDRAKGFHPFFIVATAGTTNAGVVDPIVEMAKLAEELDLWFHLDAAWGGAGVILPELKHLFKGSERADSITLDAHKWFAVPMTAGMLMTRHLGILEQTFRVDRTFYMPPSSQASQLTQPYAETMQWSRRFIGLKVFLSLAQAGWDGYARVFRHQMQMAEHLRKQLTHYGWEIVNQTELPVICFTDSKHPRGATSEYVEMVAAKVAATGQAWITTVQLTGERPALRAGIASYHTAAEHIDALVVTLNTIRDS